MYHRLLANAPSIAVVAAIIAVLVILGLRLGAQVTTISTVVLLIIVIGLASVCVALARQLRQREQQFRQTRFSVERMQALLQTSPGGYCLFTPQGLLREVVGVAQLFGIPKIAHFE